MSTRSLNKVMIIGNLTRDPELKYTPQGTAVSSFSIATNREWTDSSGQKQEGAEFHRVVAWGKLAEICSQILQKGRKIFIEGRLQTRQWKTQDGQDRQVTEIVMEEMIALDSAGRGMSNDSHIDSYVAEDNQSSAPQEEVFEASTDNTDSGSDDKKASSKDINDEIPF
jgi:single-strand DNA-binding protein